jgi:ribokinase
VEIQSPAFSVTARDATAAGDVFNAALAVALAEDRPIAQALRFANAAAAISVTRLGAQSSIPTRSEVDQFS